MNSKELSLAQARRIAIRSQLLDGSADGVLATVRRLGFLQIDPISTVAPPQRLVLWSRLGVFDRIFAGLAGEGPKPERIMIDATHLKAHRTAASLLKKGMFPVASGEQKAG